jgi:alkylation response protein AidB-like acyl-CoA dehydrogenase
VSALARPAGSAWPDPGIDAALEEIRGGAAARDRDPAFPSDAFARLRDAGALSLTVPGADGARRVPYGTEWGAVRAVAAADASVGRIYDGHLNAVERLSVAAPEPLRSRELRAVAAGELTLGVWGADPAPGEGPPARLVWHAGTGPALQGVKVFCSGAGGVERALVLARRDTRARGAREPSITEPGPPLLAYVDLSDGIRIDRDWYRGAGMRASESHRVIFDGARVLAVLGSPGELSREPWFGRDAIRTAASWAGIADSAAAAALSLLAERDPRSPLEALAAGRIAAAGAAIDALLSAAAARAEREPDASQLQESILLRAQVAASAEALLDDAVRACGSRPLASGSALDRARRDLGVFLFQHRIDPLLARVGESLLDERD